MLVARNYDAKNWSEISNQFLVSGIRGLRKAKKIKKVRKYVQSIIQTIPASS